MTRSCSPSLPASCAPEAPSPLASPMRSASGWSGASPVQRMPPGEHVRLYRRGRDGATFSGSRGFEVYAQRFRHSLETPYWLLWLGAPDGGVRRRLSAAWKDFLDARSAESSHLLTRVEDVGNRILPKSAIVVCARKSTRETAVCDRVHGLSGNPSSGAQGVFTYYLSRELTRLGHEVHVIAGRPYPEVDDAVHFHKLKTTASGTSWPTSTSTASDQPAALPPVNMFEMAATRLSLGLAPSSCSACAHTTSCTSWRRSSPSTLRPRQPDPQLRHPPHEGKGLPVVASIHHPLTIDRRNRLLQVKNIHRKALTFLWFPWVMQDFTARRLDRIITVLRQLRGDDPEGLDLPPGQAAGHPLRRRYRRLQAARRRREAGRTASSSSATPKTATRARSTCWRPCTPCATACLSG